MPSDSKPSQNISISGSSLSQVQIGGQAGGDMTLNQTQQVGTEEGTKALTPEEVAALLDHLTALLENSALSDDDKKKAVRNIETAKDEVQADEPDKDFAVKSLQRTTKVLKDAGETVEAGTNLWQKIKPIMEAISPWLGVATKTLLLL